MPAGTLLWQRLQATSRFSGYPIEKNAMPLSQGIGSTAAAPHLSFRENTRMRMSRWLMAGIGVGIAAVALRRNRNQRCQIGDGRFNKRDAALFGKRAHQTDVGGPSALHIEEGIGRVMQQPTA